MLYIYIHLAQYEIALAMAMAAKYDKLSLTCLNEEISFSRRIIIILWAT